MTHNLYKDNGIESGRKQIIIMICFIGFILGLVYVFSSSSVPRYGLDKFTAEYLMVFLAYFLLLIIFFMLPLFMTYTYTKYSVGSLQNKLKKDLNTVGMKRSDLNSRYNEFQIKNSLKTFTWPTMVLTTILLIYWSLTFAPNGLSGLGVSMTQGNIGYNFPYPVYNGKLHLEYIIEHAPLVTWSFLGAYFYSLTILTFRWYKKDLTTNLLWKLCVRFVVVYIIGLILMTIESVPIQLAFISGIAPDVVFEWIINGIKNTSSLNLDKLKNIFKQDDSVKELGISFWQAERLAEEGITSVQDLATADIPSLLINTRFETNTLLFWIDKAILKNQVGGDYQLFEKAYITTATDFFDISKKKKRKLNDIEESIKNVIEMSGIKEKRITREMLENLVSALLSGPNIQFILEYWNQTSKQIQ